MRKPHDSTDRKVLAAIYSGVADAYGPVLLPNDEDADENTCPDCGAPWDTTTRACMSCPLTLAAFEARLALLVDRSNRKPTTTFRDA